MSLFSITFASPLILAALALLPVIWWLNRLTPPKPTREPFPPFAVLLSVLKKEDTPAKSPWWLTLIRVLLCAVIILALAEPIYNPDQQRQLASGPLVIVIDDGWSTAPDWQKRVNSASILIDQAEQQNLPVLIAKSSTLAADLTLGSAVESRKLLAALAPLPSKNVQLELSSFIRTAIGEQDIGTLAVILSPSASDNKSTSLESLAKLDAKDIRFVQSSPTQLAAINSATNNSNYLSANIIRLPSEQTAKFEITGYDLQSRPLVSNNITFEGNQNNAEVRLEAPFELLNEVVRISIEGQNTAGATYLLDDSFRRRRVALFTGNVNDVVNPLLTPSHFITRAISPFADFIDLTNINLTSGFETLLLRKPSAIIMSDIGKFEGAVAQDLQKWVEGGGLLIQFAGPKIASASEHSLLPVKLRAGERQLGGALSWSEPQPLAPFPKNSPYSDIKISDEIKIQRQVLAEPSLDLSDRTWASLTDGTPIVTTQTLGAGRIVFFHTSAETSWSNLPLSGQFSEMLRRTINLARSGTGAITTDSTLKTKTSFLPPYKLLTSNGKLTNASGDANPMEIANNGEVLKQNTVTPGFYGTEDGWQAINLFNERDKLSHPEIPTTSDNITVTQLENSDIFKFKPWLLLAGLCILFVDAVIILWMSGAFSKRRLINVANNGAIQVLLIAATVSVLTPPPVKAQDTKPNDAFIIEQLESTTLAYAITGDQQVDRISRLGLNGLGFYLRTRTALEPSEPVGVDVESDDLSFYPLIYWPISDSAIAPSKKAVENIDKFMKQGGTILFDTRDQNSNFGASSSSSSRTLKLREILFDLDIPPLEPVPLDHVLTKSFYLLDQFPGRFSGSPLWVEALSPDRDNGDRPVHSGDGVSPILITSNDFAGAWALNENRQSVLPIIPQNERQRTLAFRTGINIMMYMLTGNYKADQVHIPALLERLGQ
jgi:hypothetical protein